MFDLNNIDHEIKAHVEDLIEMFSLTEEQVQDLLHVVNEEEVEVEKGEFYNRISENHLGGLSSETTYEIYSNKNEDFYLCIECFSSADWGTKITDISISEGKEFNPKELLEARKDWVLLPLTRSELTKKYGNKGEKFIDAAINVQKTNRKLVENTFSKAKYDAFVEKRPISEEVKRFIKRFGFKIQLEPII